MDIAIMTAQALRTSLPMAECIEVMKRCFVAVSEGRNITPDRSFHSSKDGTLVLMPELSDLGLGIKVATVFTDNAAKGMPVIQGFVVLFDPKTGVPLVLCDAAALTAWRTGAASGAATDVLARKDAKNGCILGSGVQARTQLLAICAVRKLREVRVWSRTLAHSERFVDEMASQVDALLLPERDVADAVRGADIICTATSATAPIFDGQRLRPGAHLNVIGTHNVVDREVDTMTVQRSRTFVDSRKSALREAGDLHLAATDLSIAPTTLMREIGAVIAGQVAGRQGDNEITLFKSVGLAIQDTMTLRAAYKPLPENL
jgi:ornithine cyclodeaminase/alanine dehydrogenase-like protein (mu-crystallin family)